MAIVTLDGQTNMRLDAELLHRAGVRVYKWSEPCVTLGMFQTPERDLRPNCPIPSIPRPTGGRAVLHGHDLTLGFSFPWDSISENGVADLRNVKKAYRAVILPVIHAFQAVGIDACLGEELRQGSQNPRSADCFAHISANDVVSRTTGQKICGCALRLTEFGALAQCSIPTAAPLVNPAEVFHLPSRTNWIELDEEGYAEAFHAAWLDQAGLSTSLSK